MSPSASSNSINPIPQAIDPALLIEAIEAINEPFFIKDQDHRWVALNQSACKVMGRNRDQLLGKTDMDLFPPEQAAIFYAKDDQAFAEGRVLNIESITWHGQEHIIATSKTVFTDPGTGKRYIAGIIHDITEQAAIQQRLTESYALLRAAIDSSGEGICVLAPDESLIAYNRQLLNIWRLSEQWPTLDATTRRARVIERVKDPHRFIDFYRRLIDDISHQADMCIDMADGRIIELRTRPYQVEAQNRGRLFTFVDITERRRSEQLVREQESRLRSITENAPVLIVQLDRHGTILYLNRVLPGHTHSQVLGSSIFQWTGPDDHQQVNQALDHVFNRKTTASFQATMVDQTIDLCRQFDCRLAPLVVNGFVDAAILIASDITEKIAVDQELADNQLRLQQIIDLVPHAIFAKDAEGRFLLANQATADLYEMTVEQLIGKKQLEVCHHRPDALRFAEQDQMVLKTGQMTSLNEDKVIRRDGSLSYRRTIKTPMQLPGTQALAVLGVSVDITDLKETEAQMHHDALHDKLTGLPNRHLFNDRLAIAIDQLGHNPGRHLAVLMLDLNRFKIINDSMGHDIGDQLLIAVAIRLSSCIKPGDTAARLGGDEYAVLMEDLTDPTQAIRFAEQLAQRIAEPLIVNEQTVYPSAAIGIATAHHNQVTETQLVRDADNAMHRAKIAGRSPVMFDEHMHRQVVNRLALESDLQRAVVEEQFTLRFQPIVKLADMKIVGFETLIRWLHPKRGLLKPYEFLDIAAETGIMKPIGRWLLRRSCRKIAQWNRHYELDQPIWVAVNLSPEEFNDPSLIEQIDRALIDTDCNPAWLKLEITEQAMLEQSRQTAERFDAIHQRGISLHIDDFGTGYSSLSLLNQLTFDMVKIDREFVNHLDAVNPDMRFVRMINNLAHALGATVTAEGIETEHHADLLRGIGCDYGQGFLIDHPLDDQQAAERLTAQSKPIDPPSA